MSTPMRKVPLKPAHGFTIGQVRHLRQKQDQWQRIAQEAGVRESARLNAQREVRKIQELLGHG